MIRVAIVGSGSIAGVHLESYALFPERCKVVALVDRKTKNAELLKAKFGLDCKVVLDYKELLDDETIDLVSICTPPHTHAQMSCDFLRAGKHVFVEKPMALSLEECDQMLAAAEESGRILSVVGQNRFLDPVQKVKHAVDSGLMGKIVHAEVDSYWWRGHGYYEMWWRGTLEMEGGGCVLNHAVHHLDMLQWIMGMPQTVQAVTSNTSHDNSEVEDLSIAILTYPGGRLAQVTSSVVHHGEEQRMVFQGERAKVSMPWSVYASTAKEDGFPQRNPALEEEIERYCAGFALLRYTGHAGQIDDVLSAIENGSHKVLIDGHEGRKTIELVMAIYEAAATGRAVTLPLAKDSIYYTRESILAKAPRFNRK